MNILVLDVGTSSMRGVLMDDQASVHTSVQVKYHPTFFPNGRVEQPPQDWENALVKICRETAKQGRVDAVAMTAQRSSMIPVDQNGQPLRNAIMWQDTRNRDLCQNLSRENPWVRQTCGAGINTVYSGGKMAWYREHEPELYAKTHKMLTVSDYLVFQMTGLYRSDYTYGSRSLLMNLREFRWDKRLLDLFGIDEEKLCQLVAPGSILGGVSKDFERKTGLRQGIPVVTCGGDQQCGALGQGVFEAGRVAVNAGTGAYLVASAAEMPSELAPHVVCSAAATPGSYILESSVLTCCSALDWFVQNLYDGFDYEEIDKELAQSPVGAGGVICLPYLQGRSAPDWNSHAKGAFFGITLATTRMDLLRALIEGICSEIGWHIEQLEEYMQIQSISVSGGFTRSDAINQIQADVYGKLVRKSDDTEATIKGAWMNAATALGICRDMPQAWKRLERTETLYAPGETARLQYNVLKQKIRRLYAHTLDI